MFSWYVTCTGKRDLSSPCTKGLFRRSCYVFRFWLSWHGISQLQYYEISNIRLLNNEQCSSENLEGMMWGAVSTGSRLVYSHCHWSINPLYIWQLPWIRMASFWRLIGVSVTVIGRPAWAHPMFSVFYPFHWFRAKAPPFILTFEVLLWWRTNRFYLVSM